MDAFNAHKLEPTHLAIATATLLLLLSLRKYVSRLKQTHSLPPGPPKLPLIGNLLDLPTEQEWRVYARWGELYGEIVHVDALGQPIVILNSFKAASELLDRRSAIYSDRPQATMMKLMNWDWLLGNVAYGDRWRLERRLLHEQLHINVVYQWRGIELRATRAFLQSLLKTDGQIDVSHRIGNLFGSIIMELVYGIETPTEGNQYTRVAQEAMHMLSAAFMPGAFLVDMIPALDAWCRLPTPSGSVAATYSGDVAQVPQSSQGHMAAGTAKRCMTTQLYDSIPDNEMTPEVEHAIKYSTGHVYAAGSDTTVSAACSLFLAMTLHPTILANAQAELDRILGPDQLPEFSHWPDLPYVMAITLELLRWQPVLPAGLPHKSTEDDVYNGWFIPKASVVIPNQWAMLHNPVDYPNPEEFRPERFLRTTAEGKVELDPTVQDPRNIAFGFGRRVCVGMHFAEQSLYIITANVLAAFDIKALVDEEGCPVYPEVRMTSGLLSHPVPFQCVVKPRSRHHKEIVNLPLPSKDD